MRFKELLKDWKTAIANRRLQSVRTPSFESLFRTSTTLIRQGRILLRGMGLLGQAV